MTTNELEGWRNALRADGGARRYADHVRTVDERLGSALEWRVPDPWPAGDGHALSGVPFAVKDNIATTGFRLTCGSRMLENLQCPYDATAVHRLRAVGAVPVAKTNLDEFGMGSSTDNSALGTTHNPWKESAVAGGSSGGSAAAVAAGLVPFALGSDTGGSVRQPAAFCGCLGLKPTYGAVSRYGLVAYASSLEVIGVFATEVDVLETVFDAIKGEDPRDQSSARWPEEEPPRAVRRVGVLPLDETVSGPVRDGVRKAADALAAAGVEVRPLDVPMLRYVVPAYYTIATAEASANLARYTGVRYGLRVGDDRPMEDMVRATRTQGFGEEVKLRILLGTYVLRSGFQDQYYVRAQKIRTLIRSAFLDAFSQVDALLWPVFPTQAFSHGDAGLTPFQQKVADVFTAAANLAGIPAVAFPTGVSDGLPTAAQLLAPPFAEGRLFDAVRALGDTARCARPPVWSDAWRR